MPPKKLIDKVLAQIEGMQLLGSSIQLLEFVEGTASRRLVFPGQCDIHVLFDFSDLPFSEPNLVVSSTGSEEGDEFVKEQFRLVCPELLCWGSAQIGARLRFHHLWGHGWSPAYFTRLQQLFRYLEARFAMRPFHELVDGIIASVVAAPFGDGVVHVRFGCAGETMEPPCLSCPEVFVHFDPNWVTWSSKDGPAEPVEPVEPGPFTWECISAQYFVIPTPYCFAHDSSLAAMYHLLDGLRVKGFTAVTQAASGIVVSLPWDITGFVPLAEWRAGHPPARAVQDALNEVVPASLRKCSPGETAGSYGG